jgi:hypothetical protein
MEPITSTISWITSNLAVLLEIVGAFSLIATLTPNKTDNEIMDWVMKAVNFLGANIGKAENK